MADLSNINLHDLAGHIEEACVRHGVNALEFSRLVGVGQPTISRIMTGRQKTVRTDVLAKFLPYFTSRPKRGKS